MMGEKITELEPGDVAFDPKTGKDRLFVRRAAAGSFAGSEIWAVEDHVAHAGSPVPWSTEHRWPWVVHVDIVTPCRDTGDSLKVTFSMPSLGPPGSSAWAAAEVAAIKRAGAHEAMESFGVDPHKLGNDTAEVPALEGGSDHCLACGDDPERSARCPFCGPEPEAPPASEWVCHDCDQPTTAADPVYDLCASCEKAWLESK
ncbi:hypothetical protein OV079_23845 [Nannocystis pusilla]|uniref:Uncharacterized protein n=1 Tax=Nannocystis pusilla TaxID=889268 RepID=A0A9X3EHB5_9BACT|nr:hypothetical protein [Nannocystis pusilla]MCY1004012.1 hypothetical protein [Nannocystis pusilla]MCY1008536.1 hypothetical protein [Nannocystis pusilla]